MKVRVTLSVAWVIALGIPARGEDSASELKQLQGTWSVVSVQEAGEEQAGEMFNKLSIVIKGNVFSFKFAGQPKTLDMQLELDPTTSPKAMNLGSTIRPGQVSRGIYALTDSELKLCWSRNRGARPDAFNTRPGDDRILLMLKRNGGQDDRD